MEANMNLRMENQPSKSYDLRMIGFVTLVLMIVAVYTLAAQFPIGPDELAAFAFPP
jgi:hypothetical protein